MPTVSVNTHFPGYEIIGEIGRSNARVLKARHLATGDLVAIKHFALNTDEETLRRFRLESQLMTEIRHPNVVAVREVALDLAMPFIVMEWVEGGNLRTLFQEKGHLDVPSTIRLGLQMAGAFQAIHPRGIIHRDIKPENILYRLLPSGEYHFLLTDFGVARLREQTQTMTGQSLMTYEYASPEQFDNPRGVDVATDYYSLGVVLYECVAGRVPFSMADSAGIASFMNQVLRSDPPALQPPDQSLPPSLEALIPWLLAKVPAQRLSEVHELKVLLGQANVEYWQAGRTSASPAPVRNRTLAAPVSVPTPAEPDFTTPEPEDDPVSGVNWTWVTLGVVVVAVLVGFFLFYRSQPTTSGFETDQNTFSKSDSLRSEVMQTDTTRAGEEYPVEETPADADTIPTDSAPPVDSTQRTAPAPVPDSTRTTPDSTRTTN
ncbi:serine/threonine-protein kinase [Larkinella bovis]|uniref:non-specific serine/threonine protein kinase n=1 Tax=Larkinella bovis TaxID=683041 RepID=A0ABW0IFZ0_9BACT